MFDERQSWIESGYVKNQEEMDGTISRIKDQLAHVNKKIKTLQTAQAGIEENLRMIQEFSIHLSFHIGEIVLIRRLNWDYPLPRQMNDFLK